MVCMDESSKQLIGEVRKPIKGKPGCVKKVDDEYVRYGVIEIFMEVEPLSVLKGQCLNRRIADMSTMQTEVVVREAGRNSIAKKIDWQFTTADARIKLRRLYPNL